MGNATTADEKMRYQLDLQARQIDAVLTHHDVNGTVTSGDVQPRSVDFDIQAPLNAGLERMRGLKSNLMAALGVRDLAVTKQDGRWRVQVERSYEPPVPLTDLLAGLPDLPTGTAAIGVSDSGQPVLLSFDAETVPHVLIVGDENAGKTTLLRTIAAGLALTNRQSDVQLLLIDGGDQTGDLNKLWHPLAYLPPYHDRPGSGFGNWGRVLHFLVGEMSYRRKQARPASHESSFSLTTWSACWSKPASRRPMICCACCNTGITLVSIWLSPHPNRNPRYWMFWSCPICRCGW
ncbi:MAG: FtsK/SpoIIIE domain-containing protein [Chloroflexota bacterium]